VHGTIPDGEFDEVLIEEVVSELVPSFFGGDVGAAGEFGCPGEVLELVDWASGLEKGDWTRLEEELEIAAVVLDDWRVTTTRPDVVEDVPASECEDEVVNCNVGTDCEVVGTEIGAGELLCDEEAITVAFEFLWTSIIASQYGKHLSIKLQIAGPLTSAVIQFSRDSSMKESQSSHS
jgi:hypothetical protein